MSVYRPGASAASLLDDFLAERPQGELEPVVADQFAATFENSYAEEMDWRNSRGGTTEDEIRRVAAATGMKPSDEAVKLTHSEMSRQATASLDETLRERFLAQTQIAAADWERIRERLVFIHDTLTAEMVLEQYNAWCEPEERAEALPEGCLSPRAGFARLNDGRPESRRFRKLGEVAEPVPADVYAVPPGCVDEHG
ncbi:MAG: hypothetical protein NTW87_21215 [Planctomycetota bacterium]|nr:hypothetical protein [Planctomycetota bacterium]